MGGGSWRGGLTFGGVLEVGGRGCGGRVEGGKLNFGVRNCGEGRACQGRSWGLDLDSKIATRSVNVSFTYILFYQYHQQYHLQ